MPSAETGVILMSPETVVCRVRAALVAERIMAPVPVMLPMLTKLPDESIRWVPAPAPVLIPVVPFKVVPVMVSALSMVPKPLVIKPPL